MKIDSFHPAKHGYHFPNRFATHLPLGITTHGLCGGMSMGALDHWRNGIAAPNHFADHGNLGEDFGGADVPREGGRFQSAILERQVHSLTTAAVAQRWAFGPPTVPLGYEASVGPEFTRIRERIDSGRPCLVGLWGFDPGAVDKGHQVLAYGYETTPMTVHVYDPNHPDEECRLRPDSPGGGVQVHHASGQDRYRGFFEADVYQWAEVPPWRPRYVDLVLTDGIRVNGPTEVTIGSPLEITATVTNMGEYDARFKALYVYVRDPGGFNVDELMHGAEPDLTRLAPGERHTITRRADTFATRPGRFTVGVSYLSLTDQWCDLAVMDGQRRVDIEVGTAATDAPDVDQWVSVPESSSSPVATGIRVDTGDEVMLTGRGEVWAGVWFTGPNGPQGWPDYVTHNPRFPLHGTPDASQFSLIGRIGGGGWFQVGRGLSRRRHSGPGGELCLWVNDDVHGNGSGAFECRVQVWR